MVIKLTRQWQRPWVTYIYESWHNLIRSLCSLYEATFQRVGIMWHINLFLKLIRLGLPRLWHCVLNRHVIKSNESHLFHIKHFVLTSHIHNERQDILTVAWFLFASCWVAPSIEKSHWSIIAIIWKCDSDSLNVYLMQYFFDPLK